MGQQILTIIIIVVVQELQEEINITKSTDPLHKTF